MSVTFPAESIKGKMLSGMGVPDILGTQGSFTYVTSDPEAKQKAQSGRIVTVKQEKEIEFDLEGPAKKTLFKTQSTKTPVKVQILDGRSIKISYHDQSIVLSQGQWSPWKDIHFDISSLKKVRGIVQFLLIDVEPHLKLYISPMSIDPREPLHPISHPGDYAATLSERHGVYATRGLPYDTWPLNEGVITTRHFLEHANEIATKDREMILAELKEQQGGVGFYYLGFPDLMQHMFWHHHDPEHPKHDANAPDDLKHMIVNTYHHMDEFVSQVRELMNPDDVLWIVSDHGFTAFKRAVHLNRWLMNRGYLVAREAKNDDENRLLATVDWKKTKAYAIGFGGIYINRKGRESKGWVEDAEAEKLKQEIAAELKAWKENTTSVVSNAYPSTSSLSAHKPDIKIGLQKGFRISWQTAMGTITETEIDDNEKHWSGDHLVDPKLVPGILFSSRELNEGDHSLWDITPLHPQVGRLE